MYADNGKFCQHSVEYDRVHTIKMPIKSSKHESNNKKQQEKDKCHGALSSSMSRQSSIEGAIVRAETSSQLRSDFIYHVYCTVASIK